jgi:hypothetical protein
VSVLRTEELTADTVSLLVNMFVLGCESQKGTIIHQSYTERERLDDCETQVVV